MNDIPLSQTNDPGLVDAHLSLALEANQMGTWEWQLATNRVVWSPALERIHGLAECGSFGGTFDDFARDIHHADRQRMFDSITAAVSGAREHYVEYRIVRPDGSVRWLEARGRLLRDSDGRPERLVGVCCDVTERKEATLRLQLSEAFYSATIMSVAEAVVTTDPDGRVTLMNGVAESLTGFRLDEARGRPFEEIVHLVSDEAAPLSERRGAHSDAAPAARPASDGLAAPAQGDRASATVTARHGAPPRRVTKLLYRRDGSQLAVDDSAAPIRDAHGEVVGQVFVFRDVTEERQEEERRRFIAEASALLTSSLDFEKTLKTIAELAVPRIADWCVIHAAAADGSLQRLAVAHKDPAKIEAAARLQRYERPGIGPANQVVQSGQSVLGGDVSEGWLRARAAANAELGEVLRSLAPQSYMIVPLRAGERILGAITFVTSEGPRLDVRDLHMAEELGRRAGTAMDNARLYRDAQRARRAAEDTAARALLIQELTAALSEAPTPSLVAEVVTSLGTKVIGAAAAAVYQIASSGDELVLVRSMGYTGDELVGFERLPMDSALPIVETVRSGRALFMRQREELDDLHPEISRPAHTFASLAVLPLEVEGRRFGALAISFRAPHDFDETERDFMVTISRLCAQALERANLYDAAQNARAEAESARRTRENLLTVVSHDLRNPLSAIATTASVLVKADPARDMQGKLARYGNNILRTARRMDRLIVDLLDLAKIESGRLLLEYQHHDAASLVKESVETLAPVATDKGLLLTADVPTTDLPIFCDRERVLQVLSNLLGNALKFTAEGGTVVVSARERQGEVRFAVRDTGCGIEDSQLPHIFDRYWQAKSAREGIGLGLSIAKGIVDAHGGRIWVETQLALGTTFFFTVPKEVRTAVTSSNGATIKI